MGQLVFQATLGGQVNLVGPNTASTFNINVPAVAGSMVTTGDTGTVTNTMLASSAYTAPGTIGSGTPNTGAFTTLSGSTSVTTPIIKSASSLTFQSNGTTTAMTIDTSQNVGIGTSSPNVKFQLAQTISTTIGNSSTYLGLGVGENAVNGLRLIGYGYKSTYYPAYTGYIETNNSGSTNGALTFYTRSATTDTAPAEVMRIDSSGNVGIGTSSPQAKFVVSNAGVQGIEFGYSAGLTANFIQSFNRSTSADVDMAYYMGSTTGSHKFYTSATERMRIDASGNLLVGATSSSETSGSGIKLTPDTGSGDLGIFTVSSASTSGRASNVMYSTGASAYRFYVDWGGTIHATSIVITAISDERLKENVRDLDTGLSTVMALKPRRYDWREGKGLDKKNAAGFIAQEFETVFPDSVGTSKAGEDGIEYKNINYEELIPTLTKAIQEQQVIITSLTDRISALEAPKV